MDVDWVYVFVLLSIFRSCVMNGLLLKGFWLVSSLWLWIMLGFIVLLFFICVLFCVSVLVG